MLKLYKLDAQPKRYWETWEHNGVHTVHWGELGTKGESKELKDGVCSSPTKIIQKEVDRHVSEGFVSLDTEDHATLLIEYAVDGMGSAADVGMDRAWPLRRRQHR